MHCPLRGSHAETARPIERIDNPNPLLGQTRKIIVALFGKQGIVWPMGSQLLSKPKVAHFVAAMLYLPSRKSFGLTFRPQLFEQGRRAIG